MTSTLTLRETAAAIGRSPDWFGRHWRDLVRDHGMPPPLPPADAHPVWSRLQIEAWLDQDLPPALARRVTVLRQVEAAVAADPEASLEVLRARDEMDRRFHNGGESHGTTGHTRARRA